MRKGIVTAVLMVGVLAAGRSAMAGQPAEQANEVRLLNSRVCTMKSIEGAWGYYGTGAVVPNSFGIPEGPTVSIGIANFDGEGGFTWTTTDVPGLLLTGTYQMNPDCTGTALFYFGELAAPGSIVLVNGGREMFIAPPSGGPMVSIYIYKRQ